MLYARAILSCSAEEGQMKNGPMYNSPERRTAQMCQNTTVALSLGAGDKMLDLRTSLARARTLSKSDPRRLHILHFNWQKRLESQLALKSNYRSSAIVTPF